MLNSNKLDSKEGKAGVKYKEIISSANDAVETPQIGSRLRLEPFYIATIGYNVKSRSCLGNVTTTNGTTYTATCKKYAGICLKNINCSQSETRYTGSREPLSGGEAAIWK